MRMTTGQLFSFQGQRKHLKKRERLAHKLVDSKQAGHGAGSTRSQAASDRHLLIEFNVDSGTRLSDQVQVILHRCTDRIAVGFPGQASVIAFNVPYFHNIGIGQSHDYFITRLIKGEAQNIVSADHISYGGRGKYRDFVLFHGCKNWMLLSIMTYVY